MATTKQYYDAVRVKLHQPNWGVPLRTQTSDAKPKRDHIHPKRSGGTKGDETNAAVGDTPTGQHGRR
jgi:hypothetical protein